jgi:hypothetical protein
MNEMRQPPPQRPKPKQAVQELKQKSPQHEPFFNKEKFNKANVIGFVILALGVLALLFVGSIAYKKLFGTDDEIAQSDIDEFRQAGRQSEDRVANRAAGEQPREAYRRQKEITEREIRETWETRLNDGRALLEIGKGRYRFILIPDNTQVKLRYYSNGNYTLVDDLILLQPDFKIGPPDSQTFEYKLLTRSKMPVMASKHKGKLVWQEPTEEAQIYVPPYHPILNRTKDKIVVWSVLE